MLGERVRDPGAAQRLQASRARGVPGKRPWHERSQQRGLPGPSPAQLHRLPAVPYRGETCRDLLPLPLGKPWRPPPPRLPKVERKDLGAHCSQLSSKTKCFQVLRHPLLPVLTPLQRDTFSGDPHISQPPDTATLTGSMS